MCAEIPISRAEGTDGTRVVQSCSGLQYSIGVSCSVVEFANGPGPSIGEGATQGVDFASDGCGKGVNFTTDVFALPVYEAEAILGRQLLDQRLLCRHRGSLCVYDP